MSGGTRTNIKTIEQMEAEAKENFDSISSKLVHGQWLEVERCLDAMMKDRFEYRYGNKIIDRTEAMRLVKWTEDPMRLAPRKVRTVPL
jgi:hypothetical protein